jgi:hypothetical protein
MKYSSPLTCHFEWFSIENCIEKCNKVNEDAEMIPRLRGSMTKLTTHLSRLTISFGLIEFSIQWFWSVATNPLLELTCIQTYHSRLFTVHHSLFCIHYYLFNVPYSAFSKPYSLFGIQYSVSTTHLSQLTTHDSRLTTHFSPLTTHHYTITPLY